MTTAEVLQPPVLPNTDAAQHGCGMDMPLSLQQPLRPVSLDAGEQAAGLGFAKKGASWSKMEAAKMVSPPFKICACLGVDASWLPDTFHAAPTASSRLLCLCTASHLNVMSHSVLQRSAVLIHTSF